MARFSYEELGDAERHAAAIERLAASARVRPEDVRPLYEQVLGDMLNEARIKTFLPIFIARKVEKLLQSMARTNS